MKRVLQVTSKLFRGGAESFIMNVYRNIDREKLQFDFLTFRSPREFYEEEVESLGGRVYHVPIMEGLGFLRRRAMLDRFFDEHDGYAAVHCHMAALGNACLASAERHGIPRRISHSHITGFDRNPRGLLKRVFERRFGNHATVRLACSDWAGRYMYGEKSYSVVNNAIDTARFAFDLEKRRALRALVGVDEKTPLVGHVGRFELVKNHEFLVDVFASMVSGGFAGKLVMAGDGSLRANIEGRVRAAGIEKAVVFLGVIEDMPSFYSAVDVFVMPSLSEGLPFSVIEAQCSGLPCVLSDAISPECKISDQVHFLSLGSGLKQWAELAATIISASSVDARHKAVAVVREAGYDILDTVGSLQGIYGRKR